MPDLLELMESGWPNHRCGCRIPSPVPLPSNHNNFVLLFSLILVHSRTYPCNYTSLTLVNMNNLPPFMYHCHLLPPRRKEGIQELALNQRQTLFPRRRRTADKGATGLRCRHLHGGLTVRLGRDSSLPSPH